MRLLIVLPKQQEATGNFVTTRRLQHGLQELGMTVELLAVDPHEAETLTTTIDRLRPGHILLLHAWRSGYPWLNNTATWSCPATVLLTGTDINHDISTPEKGPVIEAVLHKAAAVVSQNKLTVDKLREKNLKWIDRLRYIPPGVLLGKTPFHLRRKFGFTPECQLFLHPAGIRPVKANLELLSLCDQLAANRPAFAIAFCGPALDQSYFKTFISAIDQRPWAHYLGVIPSDAMPSAMAEADLILNHSTSEGMSNALLEAIAVGRPVLARNIPGNAAILDINKQTLLYDTDDDFITLAQQFLINPPESQTPIETLHTLFSATVEAQNFTSLFNSLSR
jgi:glycosyltransferase involved in cell wall biosynthesis